MNKPKYCPRCGSTNYDLETDVNICHCIDCDATWPAIEAEPQEYEAEDIKF